MGKPSLDSILGFGSYLLRASRSGISNLESIRAVKKIVCANLDPPTKICSNLTIPTASFASGGKPPGLASRVPILSQF